MMAVGTDISTMMTGAQGLTLARITTKEIMIAMGKHATTENLNRTGEFTVAFATQQTLVAADIQ